MLRGGAVRARGVRPPALVRAALRRPAAGPRCGSRGASGAGSGPPTRSTYVALGDSFTSGAGLPGSAGADPCGQSRLAYPRLVAAGSTPTSPTPAAAGPRPRTPTRPQPRPRRLRGPPQLDAVTAGTDLVTVGLGYNDFTCFGELLACTSACAGLRELPGPIGTRVAAVVGSVRQRGAGRARCCWSATPSWRRTDGTCPGLAASPRYAREVLAALSGALARGRPGRGRHVRRRVRRQRGPRRLRRRGRLGQRQRRARPGSPRRTTPVARAAGRRPRWCWRRSGAEWPRPYRGGCCCAGRSRPCLVARAGRRSPALRRPSGPTPAAPRPATRRPPRSRAGSAFPTYVALGDSYTAAPGVPQTEQASPAACARTATTRAWSRPRSRPSVVDVSCSGRPRCPWSARSRAAARVSPPQFAGPDRRHLAGDPGHRRQRPRAVPDAGRHLRRSWGTATRAGRRAATRCRPPASSGTRCGEDRHDRPAGHRRASRASTTGRRTRRWSWSATRSRSRSRAPARSCRWPRATTPTCASLVGAAQRRAEHGGREGRRHLHRPGDRPARATTSAPGRTPGSTASTPT